MLTKIYFSLWGLVGLAAATLFLAGGMTMLALTVFGFIAFGLTFMGMMGVLPILVSHPQEKRPAIKPVANAARTDSTASKVGGVVASLLGPNGIEVRKPKYP
jgi:hypothetical protein